MALLTASQALRFSSITAITAPSVTAMVRKDSGVSRSMIGCKQNEASPIVTRESRVMHKKTTVKIAPIVN